MGCGTRGVSKSDASEWNLYNKIPSTDVVRGIFNVDSKYVPCLLHDLQNPAYRLIRQFYFCPQ